MRTRPNRRTFIKLSAAAASVAAAELAHAAPPTPQVLIMRKDSGITGSEPVQWAIDKLQDALTARGVLVSNVNSSELYGSGTNIITVTQAETASRDFGVPALTQPETVALSFWWLNNSANYTVVAGVDVRGLVYGLLELAERIRDADDPIAALQQQLRTPIIETTPNKVRSVLRAFVSEVDDKPWFYDRAFWANYLDTLAAARFNRFNLSLGMGWDFPRGVTGDYLHFPYPYLVEVPGYEQVHVEPALQRGERQRNLETLQFIAAETARRGMDFQLGLWTHAYQWTDSPNSDHHIVGLTPEIHAAYCRDALAMILKDCPQITGLTMRIHGESGIPEGSYPFWQTLFEAIPAARTPDGKPRVIEIDMHAKGLDQKMIEIARATGMPVKAGAKYWAEHLGLGYQQADIRANEYPRAGVTGTFAVSAGARNFTRYGYGDFYQQNIGLDLLYRVWPGTQRHLLWGDPALAAGYGRAANFCGAAGMELCEPLTFKGREGSGHPGGRDAYADPALASPSTSFVIPQRSTPASKVEESASQMPDLDTAKFALTYKLWGRYLYNPDAAPEVSHRAYRQAYGPAGTGLETALAASSRILPLVTTAWCPSASNHEFWPEMLTPVSILPYTGRAPYSDSPAPHNVSAISPLDPQLFTTIDQHAKDLVAGTMNARYNTSEVIAWLEAMVSTSTKGLETARAAAGSKAKTAEFRRAEEDILILNGLGTFYANLFRAALLYSIAQQSQKPAAAIDATLTAYRKARESWASFSARAKTVYASDISYGSSPMRRGHWADRLPAIDADLAAFNAFLIAKYGDTLGTLSNETPPTSQSPRTPQDATVQRALHPTPRPTLDAHHTPTESFHAGSELILAVATPPSVTEAILWYRHVNHGERWLSTPMQRDGAGHLAAIPAAYTDSPYPLQYYFELHTATAATLHPAFNATLSNQPYYAVHKRA
jgi:hypothetical protein